MKKVTLLAAVAAMALVSAPAAAAVFNVDALGNSSSGGSALDTGLVFSFGDLLSVTAASDDLWSAGALPRWSNANGLISDTFATGTDESGEALGTQIGGNFGTWTQASFNAPYGSLVGRLGGVYQLLGTSFSGAAWGTGNLELFYWDSNNGDNVGSIAVNVTNAVPEPATWAMMMGGLGLVGFAMRRRRTAVSFA